MQTLKALVDAGDFVVAPVALNPVMARLAEDAGFKAIYLSGGSLGWLKCVTEANLSLSDMVQVAVDIRSVSRIPIVLDAGGGWASRCTSTAPLRCRRPPASRPSRSRTSICRGGCSTISARRT